MQGRALVFDGGTVDIVSFDHTSTTSTVTDDNDKRLLERKSTR